MPSEERDEDLVRRAVEGDRDAFGIIVERHERRVYNLALRMTGREEDARDATQDAFLMALRKLASFRGEAAFTTWLHRVTVNTCYDLLRKRSRTPLLSTVDDHEPEPPAWPDHADATDLSIDVQRALLAVPEDYRVVMILHDVQDLPYEEVAAIVGIPVGTVKSRLHRGRVALARALRGRSGAGTSGAGGTVRRGEIQMTHPEEHLSGYVDGTLATDERAEVDAHLATCATCRDEIELATRAVTMLRELPEVPVPFGVTSPLMAEAGKERTSRAHRPPGAAGRNGPPGWPRRRP